MLDFLHFNYSSDDVVKRLHKDDDFTVFKRVKQDFDPYTPEQRQYVQNELNKFLKWLQQNHHTEMTHTIQLYLSQM